jgi:transposase
MERMVALNKKEQKRLMILNEVEVGGINRREAAEILGVTIRHVKRLLSAYRKLGAAGLAHGNRGRKPSNSVDTAQKQRIIELAESRYAGFNTQHFTESLSEREGIVLSRSTVRRILLKAGVSRPRQRRAPRHRRRRDRYQQPGMLVQMDGSSHDWLEGRGDKMTLVGAIDDATGVVLHAHFRENEDTEGYFQLMEGIVAHYGIPAAVYHDGFAVFEIADHEPLTLEDQLAGSKGLTQFGRLLEELNITSIRSRSPQSRGRIERLWGTFQDRLVSELRLSGASTMQAANEVLRHYLPAHNRRFSVPAVKPEPVFRKPGRDWKALFCLKHQRTVGLDNVIRFGHQRLQVSSENRYSYARARVEVRESFDGSLTVYYQGRRLDTKPAPLEAPKLRETPKPVSVKPVVQPCKPAANHPWRLYKNPIHLDRG